MASAIFGRAALKSGNVPEQVTKNQIYAPAHLLLKGRTGAVACFTLTGGPSAIFALDCTSENAQHGGGDGMTNPAAIFCAADIQAEMRAIFDAPVLPGQFEQALGGGLFRRQTGNEPNGFDFLPPVGEFTNAVQARQLRDVREAHLFGRDRHYFDAAPFDPSVAFFHVQQLRGKNLPGGSVGLAGGGWVGCL